MKTTKKERIIARIENSKSIQAQLRKINYAPSAEDLYDHGQRFVKATKEGRMMCVIHSVSQSGMSRTMSFHECGKGRKIHGYFNFWALFKALGYREARNNRDAFIIGGCGMDMVFATHYNIINSLCQLGFISKAQCSNLEQMTPTAF
jgi:hypothetical protein